MSQAQPEVWSVSQLTRRVKNLLETQIRQVWVAGEISNFRVSPAGHSYFTLKDENSQIDAVMFRGKLMRLKFEPESGLEVLVHGLVSVYEKRGNYQIICDDMQPKGMGALQLAFEKLKAKLQEEGIFDEEHKKPLPLLPRRIGVVTSPTGAAIRDILNVIHRRFADVHVILYPARVQGDEAAEEIVAGIRALDDFSVDVMIVGRGGGSLEDLWPFNEELVVRAVHEVETPIISAVGHEIDFALTDFAADVRAPTPSAAAELVVQEQQVLVNKIAQFKQRLAGAMGYRVEQMANRLHRAQASYIFQRPDEIVRQRRQQADELRMRLEAALIERAGTTRVRLDKVARALLLLSPVNEIRATKERLRNCRQRLAKAGTSALERSRARLAPLAAHLDALSPLGILSRGYALAWKMPERELLREANQLKRDDTISVRFGAGHVSARVTDIGQDNELE